MRATFWVDITLSEDGMTLELICTSCGAKLCNVEHGDRLISHVALAEEHFRSTAGH